MGSSQDIELAVQSKAIEKRFRGELEEAIDTALEDIQVEGRLEVTADEAEAGPDLLEDLTELKGIGDAVAEELQSEWGIDTPAELREAFEKGSEAVKEVPGVWREDVAEQLETTVPDLENEEVEPEPEAEPEPESTEEPTEEVEEVEVGEIPEHFLILKEDHEASEMLASVLAEEILGGEIHPVELKNAEALLEPLPSDVSVPLYVVPSGETFETRSLDDLISTFK